MYNQLTLLIMNHGCNLVLSPFNTFQARFKKFGDVGLKTHLRYIRFSKSQSRYLAKRRLCLGAVSVINCTPPSALSF